MSEYKTNDAWIAAVKSAIANSNAGNDAIENFEVTERVLLELFLPLAPLLLEGAQNLYVQDPLDRISLALDFEAHSCALLFLKPYFEMRKMQENLGDYVLLFLEGHHFDLNSYFSLLSSEVNSVPVDSHTN